MAEQVGRTGDGGDILLDFGSQVRQNFANIEEILIGADMDLSNILQLTTHITDRKKLEAMRDIREDIIGNHKPAHNLMIVAGLTFEEIFNRS